MAARRKANPVVSLNRYPMMPYRPSTEVADMILQLAGGNKRERTKALNQAVFEAFTRMKAKSLKESKDISKS